MPRSKKLSNLNSNFNDQYASFMRNDYRMVRPSDFRKDRFDSSANNLQLAHSNLRIGHHISKAASYMNNTVGFFTSLWGFLKLLVIFFIAWKVYRLIRPSVDTAKFSNALSKTKIPAIGNTIWWEQKANDFVSLTQEGVFSAWLTVDEITNWCADITTYADYLQIVLAYGAKNTGLFQAYDAMDLPSTVSKYATTDSQKYFSNWLQSLPK